MPRPIEPGRRYMPGLDGLRAVAVLAVIAYHFGFAWAPGGLLGVGVFFTLSGYLITDLLLGRLASGKGLGLRAFWLGRARRLLPALFVMLAVVVVWVALVGPSQPGSFHAAVVAAALYVSNWQLILQHVSYFQRFAPTSPLNHLWSLGVEEQFYLLWPLLLLAGTRLIREGSRRGGRSRLAALRPRLAAVTVGLAGASALEMALLYQPGFDPSRVYYGTDTRAFALLAGAALAMVWPSDGLRSSVSRSARTTLEGFGVAGLIVVLVMMWQTNEYSPFLYEGGLVLLSVATVLVVAALVHPACRLGRVLGVAPLRWIGVRSYGIYLWSLPIVVLTTPAADHGVNLARDAAQFAATLCVSALSWRYIEQPIRRGALRRAWRQLEALGPGRERARLARLGVLVGVLLVALIAAIGLTGASGHNARRHTVTVATLRVADGVTAASSASGTPNAGTHELRVDGAAGARQPVGDGGSSRTSTQALRTSCSSVIHIGDSTSDGLISPDYLPDPSQRIGAQYAMVGVKTVHFEISGARSIVETWEGQPNGYEVAEQWRQAGYHGCWVLALGTNDTADVAVGSNVGRLARIREMMSVTGGQPVMWVNVKSLLSSGPYSEANMELWNEALLQACASYPNMRVFDWAAVAQDSWFIDDGIHYNTPGYAARSHLIAQALAHAFPASGAHTNCLVP